MEFTSSFKLKMKALLPFFIIIIIPLLLSFIMQDTIIYLIFFNMLVIIGVAIRFTTSFGIEGFRKICCYDDFIEVYVDESDDISFMNVKYIYKIFNIKNVKVLSGFIVIQGDFLKSREILDRGLGYDLKVKEKRKKRIVMPRIIQNEDAFLSLLKDKIKTPK